MSERRGLDLSFSQLAAGALATVTATVVASFFGVYGTMIGAAASSVVSTAGAAIYQHFFRRTGDKLKEAGQQISVSGLRSTLISERGSAVRVGPPPTTGRDPAEPAEESAPAPVTESPATERPPRPRDAPAPRARTLADVVDRSGTVTSRLSGDDAKPGAPAPGQRPGPDARGDRQDDTAGGADRSAFGSGPSPDRTAVGAFAAITGDEADARDSGGDGSDGADGADGDADGDGATLVHGDGGDPATTGADGGEDGDGDGATRVIGAGAGTPDGTTVLAAAEGTGSDDPDDAETRAISAMTGVSEVYSAKSETARPTFGAMLAWARGRWVVLLGSAVVVFAVVMGGVTLAEKIMNKPLSAAVQGKSGQGTTLTGGGPSTDQPTVGPTNDPGSSSSPGVSQSNAPNPGMSEQGTPNPGRTDQQQPPAGQTPPVNPTGQPTHAPTPNQPAPTGGGQATNGPGGNAQRDGQPNAQRDGRPNGQQTAPAIQ